MSSTRHLTSIGLVVFAAALGVYAWVDRESVTESEVKAREGNVFDAWRREDVTRVEVVQGAESIVLEREEKADADAERAWHMTSPRIDTSDASAVDKLLQRLELAVVVRKVDGDAGMDVPRVRGTISMGKLTYHFVLGGLAPNPDGASYLRVEGGALPPRTFVVSRDLTLELLKTADNYRVRTIVPYLSIDLAKLDVKGRHTEFSIERMDATSFRLGAGGLRASRDKLDDVWRAFAEMRAEHFVTEAEADAAVAAPVFTIAMTPKDATRPRGEILVGGACPGQPESVVVVRTAPTRLAACAPKGILQGLSATRDSLLDRRLFAAHDDEVAEVRLEASPSGASIDLARKGSGWHQRAPRDRDLAGDEVDAAGTLTSGLARAEGEVLGKETAGNLGASLRGRATLSRGQGQDDEVVELSVAAEGGAYVRRAADGAILRVSHDVARKLVPRSTALHGHQVWMPSIEGAPVSTISTQCHGTTQEMTRVGGVWSLRITAPGIARNTPFEPDVAGTLDLTDAVTRAKTEAWIADEDDGTFGFDRESCSVTLSVLEDGGARTVGFVFGAEGEGGTYVHALGQNPVFLMPPGMRKLAALLLIDQHAISVDPAAIARVTLSRGGKSSVFTKSGDRLIGPASSSKDGGESIATALGQLRADAAIHLGPALPEEGFSTPTLEVAVSTAGDAGKSNVRFSVGATTTLGANKMYFARIPGVDATFIIKDTRLAPLLEAL